jgi:hypothetical protein
MIDRTYIEAKDNWQCTFEILPPREPRRFDCLMRTVTGDFYWHTPSHQGLFPSGATRLFHADWTRERLAAGTLKLVKGTLPECLRQEQTA